MKIADVKQLPILEQWTYMVQERESIRRKKELRLEKPWTDDEILQSYRFCNMRRMDDKVSQWLWTHWYRPNYNHPNMLLACALARFINNPAALATVSREMFLFSADRQGATAPRWERIYNELIEFRDAGNTVFNGAYMVRGNDGINKIACVIEYYVKPLIGIEIDPNSMEQTWSNLLPSYGMGSFMAGQIVADLRHTITGQWRDKLTWAPMGPGSKRGQNRLRGRDPKTPLSQSMFLGVLLKHIEYARSCIPNDITKRMEAIDWQSSLCEFDKYQRALNGEGRPKQKYKGI